MLAVRARLVANPWAQVGADGIARELRKLGVEPPPRRTLERILARAGATGGRSGSGRRAAKGVPYPLPAAERPGELQEADLVGPRHLQGGVRLERDRPRRAGIIPDERVAAALVWLWERLGPPARLQLDNGGPFAAPTGLGLVMRLCLQQGVTPRFIPAREPWRSGTIPRGRDRRDREHQDRRPMKTAPAAAFSARLRLAPKQRRNPARETKHWRL